MGYRLETTQPGEGRLIITNTADTDGLNFERAGIAAWFDAENEGQCDVIQDNHTCTLEEWRKYGGMPVAQVLESKGLSADGESNQIIDPDSQVSSGSAGVPRARQIG